ncbi:MAG: DUF5685 family protein [Eubacteriales bacterium]|nr:DUF5685 family protein [Eubacteriales bacterium]
MFGYIMADRDEMKGKDMDRYRAFYCGVCREIRDAHSESARLLLTYDMTFLAILLTGLYEDETKESEVRCILHPGKKQRVIRNRYTAYAADMNLLLVYHNLMDDWLDDRSVKSLTVAKTLRKSYVRTAERYPRQERAVRRYLAKLHRVEKNNEAGPELAACLTGDLFQEIFVPEKDIWQEDLGKIGYYIGKFIYLMDAWDDLEMDRKSGSYNPFLLMEKTLCTEMTPDRGAEQMLLMQAAEAARAFERLPIIHETEILRNILYSGIWVRYRRKKEDAEKEKQEKTKSNKRNIRITKNDYNK